LAFLRRLRKSIGLSPLRLAFFLLPLLLVCFALSPQAKAVCEEGCDGFGNTFLGEGALANNTVGDLNTAVGDDALFSNTSGFLNMASGAYALDANIL
jgi:hypothetical protein